MRASSGPAYTAAQYAESRPDRPAGSGGTAGANAGPGGESDETVRSASLSARARQLTPQASEREGTWFAARREPASGRRATAVHSRTGGAPHGARAGASAAISTGGAPTPGGPPPARSSPTGAPAPGSPSAGILSLVSARTSPRKSFFYGVHNPSLHFEIESTQAQNDIRIDVIDEAGENGAQLLPQRRRAAPAGQHPLGRHDAEKRPAPKGHYSFRVSPQGANQERAGRASTSSEPLSLSFEFFVYEFPILGAHDYGGAEGRFGAPRSGHTHEGQDVMAACGTPLVAARGGKVRYAGYECAAGNYVVIDGKGTPSTPSTCTSPQPSPL